MNLQPGKYTTKLLDYGVSQSAGGFPQVFAQFSADGNTITWYGGTKEIKSEGKANSQWDITLKNLQTMGYAGDPSAAGACAKLYDGPMDAGLTMGEYDLVLANESYKDSAGVMQTKLKVQYINKPGEGGGVGKKFTTRAEMMESFSKPKPSAPAGSTGGPAGSDYFK